MPARRVSSTLPENVSRASSDVDSPLVPSPRSSGDAPAANRQARRSRRLISRLAGGAAGLAAVGGGLVALPSAAHAATTAGGQAVAIAASEAGKPYVYGGSGPSSFDCSGLVSYVYARLGVSLPHNAAMQYAAMPHVAQSQAQPGDVVFFYDAGGIYHDGIYAGGGKMWVAPHTGTVVQLQTIWTSQYLVGRPWAGVSAPAPAAPPAAPAPTAQPASYQAAQPLLREGSMGAAVMHLQQILGITADGDFGPQTLGAVEGFQRSHGLAVDGVVGPHTWAALRGGAV